MLSNSTGFKIKGNEGNNDESKDKRYQRREAEYTQDGYSTANAMVD